MNSILKLYAVYKNSISVFAVSDLTPQEFQAKTDLNTTLYIAAEFANKVVGLNYSRLITDNDIGTLTNWQAVADALTDEIIIGYTDTIPGYNPGTITPKNQVVSWDVLGTLNTFNCNYASYLSEKEGLFAFRYSLKDLKINLQKQAPAVPNLKNCLPFINGLACRPVYREASKSLYALTGAQLCWQFGKHRTPEVQLADLSALGEFDVRNIYFSKMVSDKRDFALYSTDRTGEFNLDADWYLTSDYSLREYTPIVVLGGIVILPDQYEVVSENSIRLSIRDLPVHRSLVYAKYLKADPNSQAEVAYTTESLKTYFTNAFTKQEDLSADCFVIMVKCPRVYISRTLLDVWNNGITINLFTEEGLLLHNATGTIRVYEKATYSDRKELTIQNLEELYAIDRGRSDVQVVSVPSDNRNHKLCNIQESSCTMLYIMR